VFRSFEQKKHARSLNQKLAAAEIAAAEGPLAGPILHLRQRGDAARRGAAVFLGGLIVTVLCGLVFYLFFPFVDQSIEGQRTSLNDTLTTTEALLAEVDNSRRTERETLAAVLTQVAEKQALPGSEGVTFLGALETGPDSALVFGDQGTILPWTRMGGFGARPALLAPESVMFMGALKTGLDSALVFGDESMIVPWTRAGGFGARADLPGSNTTFVGALATGPDEGLVFDIFGNIVPWSRAGGFGARGNLPGSYGVAFKGALAIGPDSAMVFGSNGTIIP
jgi:hypothetical protein